MVRRSARLAGNKPPEGGEKTSNAGATQEPTLNVLAAQRAENTQGGSLGNPTTTLRSDSGRSAAALLANNPSVFSWMTRGDSSTGLHSSDQGRTNQPAREESPETEPELGPEE